MSILTLSYNENWKYLNIFGQKIRCYSLCHFITSSLALNIGKYLINEQFINLNEDQFSYFFMFHFIMIYFFSRLFSYINYNVGNNDSVYKIGNGISSHGGYLSAPIVALFSSMVFSINYFKIIDFMVLMVSHAPIFVRIGNLCNGEIIGTKTNFPINIKYYYYDNEKRHLYQLYACVFEGIIPFLTVWFYYLHYYQLPGELAILYYILHPGIRFFSEFFKEEEKMEICNTHIFHLEHKYCLIQIMYSFIFYLLYLFF